MSNGTTVVSSIVLETSETGLDVAVGVRRVGSPWSYGGVRADARDLPPDIADALRAWLTDAPTEVR